MKKKRSEKGQALVEFAIILPILLLLLGPVVDLGRALYTKTQLQNITSDLLHMTILENEYSYQGGSFKAMEEKILSENEGISAGHITEEDRGYLINDIFNKFISTEGLDKYQIDSRNKDKYIELGPIQKGFKHVGKYPKLQKYVKYKGQKVIKEDHSKHHIYNEFIYDEHGYDNSGYDMYYYDRDGYDKSGTDINNFSAGSFEADHYKDERWKLVGKETNDNSTYYRTVKVIIPYEMKNITFMGKIFFGETTKLESSSSGIIYMGGDGRDVKEPKKQSS